MDNTKSIFHEDEEMCASGLHSFAYYAAEIIKERRKQALEVFGKELVEHMMEQLNVMLSEELSLSNYSIWKDGNIQETLPLRGNVKNLQEHLDILVKINVFEEMHVGQMNAMQEIKLCIQEGILK